MVGAQSDGFSTIYLTLQRIHGHRAKDERVYYRGGPKLVLVSELESRLPLARPVDYTRAKVCERDRVAQGDHPGYSRFQSERYKDFRSQCRSARRISVTESEDCQCGNSASGRQDHRTNPNPGSACFGLICAASARQMHSRTAFIDCFPSLPTDLEKSPSSFSPPSPSTPLSVVHLRLDKPRISSLRPVLG